MPRKSRRRRTRRRKQEVSNGFSLLNFLRDHADARGKVVVKRSVIAAAAEHVGSEDEVITAIAGLEEAGALVRAKHPGRARAYTITQKALASAVVANHGDPLEGLHGVSSKTTLAELASKVKEQNEQDEAEVRNLQQQIEQLRTGQERRKAFLKQLGL